jgi:hypothetical protein
MNSAKRDDILRLFPGVQDHTVVELLATKATHSDFEAAFLLLTNQDEGLTDAKREAGSQLSRLLDILASAEIAPGEDRDP